MATFYRCDRCNKEIGQRNFGEFHSPDKRPDGITGEDAYFCAGEFAVTVNAQDEKHLCRSCVLDVINGSTRIVRMAGEEASR